MKISAFISLDRLDWRLWLSNRSAVRKYVYMCTCVYIHMEWILRTISLIQFCNLLKSLQSSMNLVIFSPKYVLRRYASLRPVMYIHLMYIQCCISCSPFRECCHHSFILMDFQFQVMILLRNRFFRDRD